MKGITLSFILLFIVKLFAQDEEAAAAALVEKIAGIVVGCYTTAQVNCESDCTDGVTLLHGCLDECSADSDSLYTLTSCFLKYSFSCDLSVEQNAKLFANLQQCLIHQRVTLQCHDDEVFDCNKDSNCLAANEEKEKILDESVYSLCEDQLVTDTYFDCFSEKLTSYSKDPQANADAVSLGEGRVSYYQSATLAMNCQSKQNEKCSSQPDKNLCLYNLLVLNGCLDKNCQFETSPHSQYVCFVNHYESCKTEETAVNEIAKTDLRCVHSHLLSSFFAIIYLFTLNLFIF